MQKRREGIALILVIMLVMVTATIAAGAAMLGSGSWLLSQYKERQGNLAMIAEQGIEEGRAVINGDKALYPDSNYNTIENGVPVTDASGTTIPGVRRYTYVGPIGVSTGQYGVFGSVVSVAQSANGDQVVKRLEVVQESFAKFAYFTDVEPSMIAFGGGDQLFGPIHSNDNIRIYSSRATFNGPVTTAGTIMGRAYGTFNSGYTERAPRIPMPQTADLNKLRTYAQQGGLAFVSTTAGSSGQASMRIEFVNIDLNGDGDATDDDEGFMRVYTYASGGTPTAAFLAWVVANIPSGGMTRSRNCGDWHPDGTFHSASPDPLHVGSGSAPAGPHSVNYSLTTNVNARACYLGGDPRIWNGWNAGPDVMSGRWLPWAGTIDPRLVTLGRADRGYLFPLSRALNPRFKGVIFVDGKVAVSGTLRSNITLAATSDIVIADDVRYSVDPGAGTCRDMMGLFAGNDVVVADNTLNAPTYVSGSYRTYDDTSDEFIQGVILALSNFEVQNYSSGSTNAQPCSTTRWGRGCLYLTGGIIQKARGAVGTGSGTGYLKRYSYDPCAFTSPPPYFPTTGHFARSRVFDVDATGFSAAALFRSLSPY